MKQVTFSDALNFYIEHLESVYNTLPMTLILLQPFNKKAVDEMNLFIEQHRSEKESEDQEVSIALNLENKSKFDALQRNITISSAAYKILPESLFVSLISQYDAFIGKVITAIFLSKPELLNSSEKSLTFSQIVELGGMEEAKNIIIEKEVDTVIRGSHAEHFSYLEKKLSMPLTKNLKIWSDFIEITERRNLLVHCDGVVSRQYLINCKAHDIDVSKIKLGETLDVSLDYFNKSFAILYELAVKLTHTIWRKMKIEDLKDADYALNSVCYSLLEIGHFELADNILEFACSQKKHHNDTSKNVFIINRALSLYLQDKQKECTKIINEKDWSACSDDFKLASFILLEVDDIVFSLMQKMGKNGDIGENKYKTWPLFYKIRTKQAFKDSFKEIFEVEYTIVEKPLMPIHDFVKKRKSQNKTQK